MSAEPTDAPPPPPAAPAPVRRGRGTFGHRLRTEEMELRQQQLMQSMEASSILTSATTTVVLPATVMGVRSRAQAEEADALAAEQSAYAEAKRNIPLDLRTSNGAPTGGGTTTTASRIHFDPNLRSQFNMYGSGTEEVEDAGTIRQLLFCGDKRRRYCLLVGDLQSTKRQVTLKLFGHRGPKPFKLQNRLIRLVNLSIGKPRVYVPKVEEGEEAEPGSEEEGEDGPRVEEEENDVAADDAKKEGSTAEQDESPVEEEKEEKEGEEEVAAAPSIPACPMGLGGDDDDAPSESSVPRKAAIGNEPHSAGRSHSVSGARDADEFDDDEAGDVDQYLENDEVVPLTVQLDDSDLTHEHSLANSPMLTSRSYAALTDYFLREFRFLFSMSDVRSQHVTINLNVGAAYCCLARHGSHSTPLKHATFGEFVSRMNNESMQLYFIKDCPPCVSRAVDIHCGAQCQEATLTVVKIYFFSNERQGKSVARAVWDSCHNGFRLLDMENTGVSFNWTIFSLDESTAASRGETAAYVPEADDAAGEPTTTTAGRSKTVAYPVEVEFRAFRRWKQHNDHPAAPLAEAILEKLSVAEHNLLNHGSSIGYERMDLSHVCEADYDSEDFNVDSIVVEHTTRVKPFGTDLIVDSTTSLFIENFAAARQLKESITFHGEQEVAARQNAANNNYLRQLEARRGRGTKEISFEDLRDGSLQPTSKLTFFRSRGSTIHWKLSPAKTTEENIAPMEQALLFTKRVLETANCIERNSARSGEAPSAL